MTCVAALPNDTLISFGAVPIFYSYRSSNDGWNLRWFQPNSTQPEQNESSVMHILHIKRFIHNTNFCLCGCAFFHQLVGLLLSSAYRFHPLSSQFAQPLTKVHDVVSFCRQRNLLRLFPAKVQGNLNFS